MEFLLDLFEVDWEVEGNHQPCFLPGIIHRTSATALKYINVYLGKKEI